MSQWDRGRVAAHLIDLLARENLYSIGFDMAAAQAALLTCAPENGAADFGDAITAACARSAGIYEIYSFDRRVGRAGLEVVPPG